MHQRTCNQHLSQRLHSLDKLILDAATYDMLPFEPSPDRIINHVAWLTFLDSVTESRLLSFTKSLPPSVLVLLLVGLLSLTATAQTDEFGDAAADPIKLFERGQGAHARGEFEKALDYYNQALKVRPEFPEAEFQRGNAVAELAAPHK